MWSARDEALAGPRDARVRGSAFWAPVGPTCGNVTAGMDWGFVWVRVKASRVGFARVVGGKRQS